MLLSSLGRIRKDTDSGGPDPVNRTYHPSASPGRNAYTACGLDLDIEHTAAHGTDYGTTIGIGPSSHYRRHRPFIAWPCNEPGAPTAAHSDTFSLTPRSSPKRGCRLLFFHHAWDAPSMSPITVPSLHFVFRASFSAASPVSADRGVQVSVFCSAPIHARVGLHSPPHIYKISSTMV